MDLPDTEGLRYLARLLAAPGQEVHALDLVAEVEGVAADPASGATAAGAGLVSSRSDASVYDRIRRVVKRLREIHPDLAAHLDASVRTGRTCAYRPERPLAWRID